MLTIKIKSDLSAQSKQYILTHKNKETSLQQQLFQVLIAKYFWFSLRKGYIWIIKALKEINL